MINGDSAINIWLQIAGMVIVILTAAMMASATLFGPSLAEITKALIAMPNPSPDEKKPKNRSQSHGGSFKERLILFWAPWLSITANLILLALIMSVDSPPTRGTVLSITGSVAAIVLSFVYLITVKLAFFIIQLSEGIAEVSGRTVKVAETLRDTNRQTWETIEKTVDALGVVAEDARKKPDAVDALRETVKKLLGHKKD